MTSPSRLLTLPTLVMLVGTAFPVAAQQAAGLAGRAGSKAAVRAGALATIKGTAYNSINSALPDTMVRLRDVKFGRIVGSAMTDKAGAYSFSAVDPGNYIVEIVSTNQTSMAATSLLNVNAGDTVSSVVRLPFKASMLANMLGGQVAPLTGGKDLGAQLQGELGQLGIEGLQGVAAVVPAGTPISER